MTCVNHRNIQMSIINKLAWLMYGYLRRACLEIRCVTRIAREEIASA